MSVLGFGDELNYEMLRSHYPARKTEVRKQPTNGNRFSTAGQIIQCNLPKMENSFYNPQTMYLTFQVNYTCTGTVGTDTCNLLGSAYSHFSRQVISVENGLPIETIENPSLLMNSIMSMTLDPSEKQALSPAWGFSASLTGTTNVGISINDSSGNIANATKISYSVPLIGVVNTMKLLPAFVSGLNFEFTLNNISNFIGINTANAGVTAYEVLNVELVCEALTLEEAGFQEILSMYPNVLKLKSQSFLYGSSSIAVNSVGVYDINYTHSLNSLKQFIWWSSPTDANDKQYGGVNPNCQNWNLIIGSTSYPQQPVKVNLPSEAFTQNKKSWASLYASDKCGCANLFNFARTTSKGTSTALELYSNYAPLGANGVTSVTASNANKWFQCLDLEVLNQMKGSLYTGIGTKGSSNTIRLNIANPLATTSTIHFFSHFDCILEFDYMNQNINIIQ